MDEQQLRNSEDHPVRKILRSLRPVQSLPDFERRLQRRIAGTGMAAETGPAKNRRRLPAFFPARRPVPAFAYSVFAVLFVGAFAYYMLTRDGLAPRFPSSSSSDAVAPHGGDSQKSALQPPVRNADGPRASVPTERISKPAAGGDAPAVKKDAAARWQEEEALPEGGNERSPGIPSAGAMQTDRQTLRAQEHAVTGGARSSAPPAEKDRADGAASPAVPARSGSARSLIAEPAATPPATTPPATTPPAAAPLSIPAAASEAAAPAPGGAEKALPEALGRTNRMGMGVDQEKSTTGTLELKSTSDDSLNSPARRDRPFAVPHVKDELGIGGLPNSPLSTSLKDSIRMDSLKKLQKQIWRTKSRGKKPLD